NGRESRRFTFPPEVHRRPVWSPDGRQMALGRSVTVGGGPLLGILDLLSGAAQQFGAGQPLDQAQKEIAISALPTDWSSDGRFIALDDGVGDEVEGAWIADVAAGKIVPFLQNKFQQWGVAFSPDVKRIAFVSSESGRPEVAVQAFDAAPF